MCTRAACTRAVCTTSLGLSVSYNAPHTYVSHISSAPKIRICRYVCTKHSRKKTSPWTDPRTGPPSTTKVQQQYVHSTAVVHVPRVCCVIPSYTVSAHLVSYCLLVRQQQRFHHPTLRTSTDFWWDVSNSVLRHPVSYIVSAYLVSYCLLVRQQQRFHHPTLRTSTVILVACIEQSTISDKHVHCCILVHVSCFLGGVGMLPVIVRTYLVCVASSRVLFC